MRLELGTSRVMGLWLLLVHITPLLLLPLLHLPLWLSLAASTAILYSLLDSWRRQVRRSHPDAVRSLDWNEAGHCQLFLNSGQQQKVELDVQAFIQPWMVVLHFRTPHRRLRYLPVLADMLDEEAFRQLRVRLRIAMDQGPA